MKTDEPAAHRSGLIPPDESLKGIT
jgi:hypothetical protein